MSSKYVVTRYGVLLAHSLRCGFMIQRPKSQRFYTFILCYEKKLCTLFSSVKQWSKLIFEAVGGKWLYRYAYFEALLSKLQKQIEEVHFTVRQSFLLIG